MARESVIEKRRLAQIEKAKANGEALDTGRHQEFDGGEIMTRVYKKKSANSKPEIIKISPQETLQEPEQMPCEEEKPMKIEKTPRASPIETKPTQGRGRPSKKQDEEEGEEICFYNGDNTLKIKYFRKENRMYCVKVFLNDDCEIRPVNYPGNSAGNAYWQLLKGSMKK